MRLALLMASIAAAGTLGGAPESRLIKGPEGNLRGHGRSSAPPRPPRLRP